MFLLFFMVDLAKQFKPVAINSRLLTAASNLEKLAKHEGLDEQAQESLAWFGSLIGAVDSESVYHKRQVALRFSAEDATQVVPCFLQALIDMGYSKSPRDFLDRLYKTLELKGYTSLLSADEVIRASHLAEIMAERIRVPACGSM